MAKQPKQLFMDSPSSHTRLMYGLYNYNNLVLVRPLKKDCKVLAEIYSGECWDECKKYLQIRKVKVSCSFPTYYWGRK